MRAYRVEWFTFYARFLFYKMKIHSSNIKSASYNRRERTLTLYFINRPRWKYIYSNVPVTVWIKFQRAESQGKYFHDYIKDEYLFKRIVMN